MEENGHNVARNLEEDPTTYGSSGTTRKGLQKKNGEEGKKKGIFL